MSTEWKMVPVEPTPEMVAAAFHGVIEPQDCLAQQRGRERMAEFYRLMLAASPQPAAQPWSKPMSVDETWAAGAQASRCGLTECRDKPMCEPCRKGLRGEKYGPEQPEPGVLTDTQIEFALNCHLEDPSDDESSGFYAGARWAEAFLSTRKLSDEQVARIMEAVDTYGERRWTDGSSDLIYQPDKSLAARADIERLLRGEA